MDFLITCYIVCPEKFCIDIFGMKEKIREIELKNEVVNLERQIILEMKSF